MIPISSVLQSKDLNYLETKSVMESQQFSLGGNWEYKNGSFDRALEDENKVWLRIPFEVFNGHIDTETADDNTMIRIGTPYVLKHLYNEGNDPTASVRVMGAMFDQFQPPVNPDADIEPKWVDAARKIMNELERLFPS